MRISDWSSDVCSSDLGREIEEGQERLAVLYQAFGGLGILDPVFLDEDLDGGFRRRPVRCVAHLAQIVFHSLLDGLRHLVEDVGDLVYPTSLVAGRRKQLVERLPETEGSVPDGDLRRDGPTAGLQVDQQFPPRSEEHTSEL